MKLYYNAHIYKHDETCFVEDGGFIIALGNDELKEEYNCQHIDLKGQYVYPGFNDSHMHLLNYGKCLSQIMLDKHTSSLTQMLQHISDNINNQQWVVGRGWNHDYFNDVDRFPTRKDLDFVSTELPIVIVRACGHVAVCNSKAIELIDLHEVEGGRYNVETGLFEENAVNLITDSIPSPSHDDIKQYILNAQKKLNAYGITSIQSDDLISVTHHYHDALDALIELEKENKLTVRIYEQCQLENIETIRQFIEEGYHTGWGNDYFKIGPLKIIGDGSLGARTAALMQHYHDGDSSGMTIYPYEELKDMISYASHHGMQCAVHAIGNQTIEDVLNVYETLGNNTMRHGIVHCQITTQDQLDRFAKNQIHAYIQTPFLDYDNHIVESRVGKDIAQTSYNFKTLYENTSCSNGSDCPVEVPDVLRGIKLAMTRTSLDGTVFLKEQALDLSQAIDSYTIGSAYASFDEDRKGTIDVGMLCDFVVLDHSLEEIDHCHIMQTYVGGQCVYEREV